MSAITTMSVESAIAILTENTGRWVTNTLPDVEDYIEFEFEREQFALAQAIVSGASLGESLEKSVSFLVAREQRLHEEADGNREFMGCYTLGNNYCSSGWQYLEVSETTTEVSGIILWYETTSGTILAHMVTTDGAENHLVYLPEARKMGFHHKELSRVKAGMTRDQYDRWYNSHCLDGKEAEYAESAEFHNTHLVPLGWEPVHTGTQFVLERDMDNVLQYVHGDWAQKYGIGEQIREILGPPGEKYFSGSHRPRPALTGHDRLVQARFVLRRLEEALQDWRSLVDRWEAETPGVEPPLVEEDYEDYEGDDSDFEFDE